MEDNGRSEQASLSGRSLIDSKRMQLSPAGQNFIEEGEGGSIRKESPLRDENRGFAPSCQRNEGLGKVRRWQQLEESNDELKRLEATIRNAYMLKALEAQVEERKANLAVEKAQERYASKVLRRKEDELRKEERKEKVENLRGVAEYRKVLREQVLLKEREKLVLFEEACRERMILEGVSRLIEERDDSKLLQKKCDLADKMRREMQIFQETKEIFKQKEAEALRDECDRIERYVEEDERKTAMMKMLRDKRDAARQALIEAVARGMLDARSEKLERESIIVDLGIEERKCEMLIREREEECRRRKIREEIAMDLELQMRFIEERKRILELEDRMFAEAVLQRVMEDNRIERLTAEARRQKQMQYRKELMALMEERRVRHEEDILRLRESLKMDQECKKRIQEQIREERKYLLLKHANNVASFIDRAALTSEEYADVVKVLKTKCEESSSNQ